MQSAKLNGQQKGDFMRILSKTVVPAILVSTLATSAIAESTNKDGADKKALFVQHADSATLSDGTLTLDGVDKHMIVFSDRPFRAAMTIQTDALIEIWNKGSDSFAEDPPNAALVGEVDGKATSVIVELTNPKLDKESLTFNYVVSEGQDSVTLERSYIVLDETFWGDLLYTGQVISGDPGDASLTTQIPG